MMIYNKKLRHPVNWKFKTLYVDEETGEPITKHIAKKNYKIIKTDTHERFTNAGKTTAIQERTNICRNKRQGELPFTD